MGTVPDLFYDRLAPVVEAYAGLLGMVADERPGALVGRAAPAGLAYVLVAVVGVTVLAVSAYYLWRLALQPGCRCGWRGGPPQRRRDRRGSSWPDPGSTRAAGSTSAPHRAQ